MGKLTTMGPQGHSSMAYTPDGDVEEARATFYVQLDLGATAFKRSPETGEYDTPISEFEPDADIVLVPMIAGGGD